MALSFKNRLERNAEHPLIQTAELALKLHVRSLGADTVEHSFRTARMATILCFNAGVPLPISDASTVGALLHDYGKNGLQEITGSEAPLTEEQLQQIMLHPERSQQYVTKLFADSPSSVVVRFAGVVAGGHHMHNADPAKNYPTFQKLGIAQSPQLIRLHHLYGPITAQSDFIEATTNPEGRYYREGRFAEENVESAAGVLTLRQAVQLANESLVPLHPAFELDPGKIEDLFLEHQEFIGTNFLTV